MEYWKLRWTKEKVELATKLMKNNACKDAYVIFKETYPDCTKSAFDSAVYRKLKLKSGGKPKLIERKNRWKPEEIELLKNLISSGTYKTTIEEFQKHYDRTYSAIITKIKDLGFKSNPEALKKQFKEGDANSRQTRFKKGSKPVNKAKIGSVRYRNGSRRHPYFWVKIKDTGGTEKDWELAQRYFYKKYHGEIPKGNKVIFVDGDISNFSKENLKIVTNKEFGYAIKYFGESIDQTEAGIAIGKIKARLDEMEEIKGKK